MESTPEKQLHEIDERFRLIADTASVMIWMADPNKKCTFFNQGWLDFTGRTHDQEYDQGWAQNIHPEDFQTCSQVYHNAFDLRQPFSLEYRVKRHDGQYRWILDKGVPCIENGVFLGFIGSCIDIHEQRQTHELLEEKIQQRVSEVLRHTEELRKQKEIIDAVFNASVDVMIVYDKDFSFLSLNESARKIYGIDERVIGKKVLDVYPQMQGTKGYADLQRAMGGKNVHNAIYFSPISKLYYEDFLIPLKDEQDETYAVLVIARNITERIESESELKGLNEKLLTQNTELQNNNEELESFNYIASHDLQEPLRKVNMFASRILEIDGGNLSERSRDYFDRITSATTRMQNLIQALLDYSRAGADDLKFVKTDLNKILKEVRNSLEESITRKQAVIEVSDLPSIRIIPLQFQQLLHNLISNALKYSKADLTPHIKISAERVKLAQRNDEEFWKISVLDNGIGFSPEYKHKIFELFQRLHGKQEYEGTGIGLAICRKITALHNGFITAEGELGKGATFEIFLPLKN